jgi:hypothetical protein
MSLGLLGSAGVTGLRAARATDKRRQEFCPRDRSKSRARRRSSMHFSTAADQGRTRFRELRGLRQFTSAAAAPNVIRIASTSRIELALYRFVTELAQSAPDNSARDRRTNAGHFRNRDELAALRNAGLGKVIASKRRSNGGVVKNGWRTRTHDLSWRVGGRFGRDVQSLGAFIPAQLARAAAPETFSLALMERCRWEAPPSGGAVVFLASGIHA